MGKIPGQHRNSAAEYAGSSGVTEGLGFYSSKSICQSTATLQTLSDDFPPYEMSLCMPAQ